MIGRASLALALAAWPAFAQEASDQAPERAPTPPARSGGVEESAADSGLLDVPAGEEPDVALSKVLDPREEDSAPAENGDRPALVPPEEMTIEEAPAGAAEGESPASAAVDSEPDEPPEQAPLETPQPEALAETPEELAACLTELDALGVTYERTEPIAGEGNPACGIANPLIVAAVAPDVAFEPPATMRCATALVAARWVAGVVVPLSQRLERGDLVAIEQGTAYLCRPRADGEMSEHAWGNAIDVMGFRFAEGEPIVVQPRAGDGTIEEAFQRAVRAGACLDFPTVLGPGSDADHADHLHFDIKARDGGFRICE